MVMKEGTQTITFRIPQELKLQIEIEAVKQGRSVNNLLKQIVIEYLKNPKKQGVGICPLPIGLFGIIFLLLKYFNCVYDNQENLDDYNNHK